MAELRKRRYDVAFEGENVEVLPVERTVMPKGTENEEHSKGQTRGEREMHQIDQNSNRKALYLFIILLGVCVSTLLYFWFLQQNGFTPVWTWDPSSEPSVITVYTNFTPLQPSAFLSFIDSEKSRQTLHGVLSWKMAAVSWSWVRSRSFGALLPAGGISAEPGYVWKLLPDTTSNNFMFSNKYVPPPPSGPVEELLFHLLSLFHPQPFLQSRYGPRGAAAVVQAKNSDCLDIWFRVHAEFQLNTPPRWPLWFTPAAFIGRLIINATDLDVKFFSLHVPTDKPLNVDLEWLTGPNEDEDMEVTITFIREMSAKTAGPVSSSAFTWTQQIQEEESLMLLEKELYQFMQVEYHNFTEAYRAASYQGQPVHSLVLWGVLGDQSC
ncbi:selenoprotein N-like isoform X1 [Panulirus ornatus]|uniref:selenoprotein N-like isoform X1 n=1 Tax=Panulirus ornatus TaxID=150431 RepID=UPI003A86D445